MYVLLCDPSLYTHENAPPPSLAWLTERFTRLESRASADGSKRWLNWVLRLPDGRLAGFVQASVEAQGRAHIAYVLGSAFWGQGLARHAVATMIDELILCGGVRQLCATLKRSNRRSFRLLDALGFAAASPAEHASQQVDADEWLMLRGAQLP